mmetsp:Transcript_8691/g.11277  ORF Transcript_8691/g.11277 Transcript_8691/m.11277 type:complete len:197 (+) Transcript_8691:38-628(+)
MDDDPDVLFQENEALLKGRGIFCLIPGVTWFQGHFVAHAGTSISLGLLATENEVEDCVKCCHGNNEHSLAIINHQAKKKKTVLVQKIGGNFMELVSEEVSFRTNSMKTEAEMMPLLKKYFQPIIAAADNLQVLQEQCVICVGEMEIKSEIIIKELKIFCKEKDEIKDEPVAFDSSVVCSDPANSSGGNCSDDSGNK